MIWVLDCGGHCRLEEHVLDDSKFDLPFSMLQVNTVTLKVQSRKLLIKRIKIKAISPIFPALALFGVAFVFNSWLAVVIGGLILILDMLIETGLLYWVLMKRKIKREGWSANIQLLRFSKVLDLYVDHKLKCHK